MPHNDNTIFSDELRKYGVNSNGYGILFKYPMLDPALTIEAKGIYCYICSYAGSDSTAFPGRERITSDLQMSKDSYYKHYQILLANDYIRVRQENRGGNSHGFAKNIYEIVEHPRKFQAQPSEPAHAESYAKIRLGGLHDAGFGFIPRSVMVDHRLSVKAKALYGYYRSFSGVGECACPEKKHLLYHLGISSKLYQRLIAELEDLNYITIEQRHINGRLSVNDILINSVPDESRVGERQLHVVYQGKDSFSHSVQKQDTQKQDTQIQERQKQDTQIQDINKKKPNITNSFQKQSNYQQIDGEIGDSVIEKKEKQEEFSLSSSVQFSKEKAKTFVYSLIDFEERERECGDTEQFNLCRYFTEALIEMLSARQEMNFGGEHVASAHVLTLLKRHIRNSAGGTKILMDIEEKATDQFEFYSMNREIQNPVAYFKSCIWTVLKGEEEEKREEWRYIWTKK